MSESAPLMERNIRIYPWYQAASNFLPWLPVFFLYFNQYITTADALMVSSAYYLAVFFIEVPSGYLSDRFGRKRILLAATLCAVIAYGLFIVASGLLPLILAQCFLAGFFALKSGSDNSLLYDSLQELGRQEEYASHEAAAEKISLLSMSLSGLAGGACGYFNLYFAYGLSLVAALVALMLVWRFREPPVYEQAQPFFRQLQMVIGKIKQPVLGWIFCFFVVTYSLAHVPAEFAQPYIKLLFADNLVGSAPVSGVVIATSMLFGAFGASVSLRLLSSFGLSRLLNISLVIQLLIIVSMAWVIHPAVLCLIMFRNFSMALTHAPMMGAIAPQINSAQRATYLSVQSLAGRLGFAVVLYGLSHLVRSDDATLAPVWPQLSLTLWVTVGIGLLATGLLVWRSNAAKGLSQTSGR